MDGKPVKVSKAGDKTIGRNFLSSELLVIESAEGSIHCLFRVSGREETHTFLVLL